MVTHTPPPRAPPFFRAHFFYLLDDQLSVEGGEDRHAGGPAASAAATDAAATVAAVVVCLCQYVHFRPHRHLVRVRVIRDASHDDNGATCVSYVSNAECKTKKVVPVSVWFVGGENEASRRREVGVMGREKGRLRGWGRRKTTEHRWDEMEWHGMYACPPGCVHQYTENDIKVTNPTPLTDFQSLGTPQRSVMPNPNDACSDSSRRDLSNAEFFGQD